MKNVVKEAIEALGGRIEDVAVVARAGSATVWRWRSLGFIPKTREAVLIANACTAAGHPEITVARLAGMNGEGGPNVAKAG